MECRCELRSTAPIERTPRGHDGRVCACIRITTKSPFGCSLKYTRVPSLQPPPARYDEIERPGVVLVDNTQYAEVSEGIAFSPHGGLAVTDYASAV